MLAVVLDRVDVAQDESDRTKIGRLAITWNVWTTMD